MKKVNFYNNKNMRGCTIGSSPEHAYGPLRVKIGPIYVEILASEIISTDLDLEESRLNI